MKRTLFDQIARTYRGPGKRTEPQFAYLNRSARDDVDRIRKVLERWFEIYPDESAADLRSRFRSKRAADHQSAFFELLLHELLLKLGLAVAVHPTLATDSSRHPDFLATALSGEGCYVEATLAMATSSPLQSDPREAAVLDALDDIECDDFFLHVETDGALRVTPNLSAIARRVETWVASLDASAVDKAIDRDGYSAMPSTTVDHEEWTLTVSAFPKSPARRGRKGDRAIGAGPTKGGVVDDRLPIYRSVLGKAKRYGRLDQPFVIAVNAVGHRVDQIDELEALFGKERITFAVGPQGATGEPALSREPDSIWVSPQGPRYTRVDAVMIFRNVQPWSAATASCCTYLNPWGGQALPAELLRLPHARGVEGEPIQWVEGESLGAILGLAPDWLGTRNYRGTSGGNRRERK